jgi:hypothetical protein
MSIPAKITTRRDPAGWVAEVVTLEFGRCVFSTLPRDLEIQALGEARLWLVNHRRGVYQIDALPKGGLTVDLFDLEDFDLRR